MSLLREMKHPHISHFFLKIAIITSILLGCFQLWIHFGSEENLDTRIAIPQNSDIYQSAYSANLWSIGVALSTRIGINYDDGNGIKTTFYKEISSVGINSEDKRAIRSDMIGQNMLIIWEYLNLSRTDIKTLLDSSPDRKKTLEWFISQLELRYKNSALSLNSLEKQKNLLLADLSRIESDIEKVKSSMETHFWLSQARSTLDDVDDYFELRAQYTESFTDIVFINQFLKQHAFLNNYNKWILDTLINNKEAIINQSYVVIPDSWDQYLRPLELLFDEAEIKAKQKTEE